MTELSQNEFEIVFQGERHEIDAKILAETINNFDILVNEIKSFSQNIQSN